MLLKDPNLWQSQFFVENHALYCTVKKQKKLQILIKLRATALVIQERPQAPTFRSQCSIIFLCLQGCCSQCYCCNWLSNAVKLHLGQFLLLTFCNQPIQLCRAVSNQSFQVADKFVDKPLALYFADHVSIIVISVKRKKKIKLSFQHL